MAVYTLSGGGTQGLTTGTGKLYVSVTVFPTNVGAGRASPVNYYDIGLLRLGDHGSFYPAIPIDSHDMVVAVPSGITTLGYSLFGPATIQVTEVAGQYPFAPSLDDLRDVTAPSPLVGQVLQWNGTSWVNATPSGGGSGGGDLTLITSQIALTPVGSITFSSIPQTFTHLRLMGVAATSNSGAVAVTVLCNGDSGNNYTSMHMEASASSVTAGQIIPTNSLNIWAIPGSGAPAGAAGYMVCDILAYTSTALRKYFINSNGRQDNDSGGGTSIEIKYGAWKSTAPITSLSFTPSAGNFVTGSVLSLYGFK